MIADFGFMVNILCGFMRKPIPVPFVSSKSSFSKKRLFEAFLNHY